MNVTRKDIQRVITDNNWSFMNRLLYEMCSKHWKHDDAGIIMGKVCLIGRSYSAAIERGRANTGRNGDHFYERMVAPTIMRSDIDVWLRALRRYKTLDATSLAQVISTHFTVMRLFRRVSGLHKRSLASKYLHFHLPHLFFIYDSRAAKGLRIVLPRHRIRYIGTRCDKEYAKFCHKMFYLQKTIQDKFGVSLTPRQLDRLLLSKV